MTAARSPHYAAGVRPGPVAWCACGWEQHADDHVTAQSHLRSHRMASGGDPDTAGVTFEAPCPCGLLAVWTATSRGQHVHCGECA